MYLILPTRHHIYFMIDPAFAIKSGCQITHLSLQGKYGLLPKSRSHLVCHMYKFYHLNSSVKYWWIVPVNHPCRQWHLWIIHYKQHLVKFWYNSSYTFSHLHLLHYVCTLKQCQTQAFNSPANAHYYREAMWIKFCWRLRKEKYSHISWYTQSDQHSMELKGTASGY